MIEQLFGAALIREMKRKKALSDEQKIATGAGENQPPANEETPNDDNEHTNEKVDDLEGGEPPLSDEQKIAAETGAGDGMKELLQPLVTDQEKIYKGKRK